MVNSLVDALRRRYDAIGFWSTFRIKTNAKIVFLDLGLYRTARQTRLMLKWFPNIQVFGFEANPEYCSDAKRLFENDNRVTIVNAALVGLHHHSSTANLHIAGNEVGDSLFEKRKKYGTIEVPATRLSQFIRNHKIDATDAAIILRMNIEGAEILVLEDLIASGLAASIQGWFGMWDDCLKIDSDLGSKLEQMKRAVGIINIPFNDRHSRGTLASVKQFAIRYDVITRVLARKA